MSGLHALPRWPRRCCAAHLPAHQPRRRRKSPLPRILSFAEERGWRWLQLLSTAGNAYDRDYFGEGLVPAVRKQQDFKDGEEWTCRS